MNIQEYISSGIIESYVLGLATAEERAEFERICAEHPEVRDARDAFERSLEALAMEHAMTPAAVTKEKTMRQIGQPLSHQHSPARNLAWLKYAAAACLIILAGSLYWNISQYNQNRRLKAEYDQSVAKLSAMEQEVRLITNNPNVRMASMKGMEAAPGAFATVYWDTTSHDVYLMLNNLPKPASDRQYQLWALLDGKPIDVGMIDNEYFVKENKLLIRAKNVQNAQAFAITLEAKDRPDTSTPQGVMYVLGNL